MRWIALIGLGLAACTGNAEEDTDQYETGACDCGAIYQPVCANGTTTYENECQALVCRGTDQIQTTRRVSCATVPHGHLERVSLTAMTQPVR